ncbi:MAG: 4-hydroxythreonine-4-phosphate dehydrogenase PdxA [Chitinophagaceae bacterium]|nr:MAG: 4-hydroxythreonine-4-phosphate dehydrogenase PdxA [Chitinophagaceae bacterium]
MNRHSNLPVIGITLGDFNGIGAEVILKVFSDNRMLKYCTPVIFGSSKVMNYHKKMLELQHVKIFNIDNLKSVKHKQINLINCLDDNPVITIGQPTEQSGKYALQSIDAAIQAIKNDEINAIVTAPINKEKITAIHKDFSGHTEYLEKAGNVQESLMFLVSENIRVGLLSNHVALKDAGSSVTVKRILQKLKIMEQSLMIDFGIIKPKIAVLGLNPHAGEEGTIGTEEKETIIPAVEKATESGILTFGPFPADGFFGASVFKKFDGILAMYHDQGLVPFKTLSFGSGVNFTAGLPFVRTSPDHGTAYDIAGKNLASADSFRNAVFQAIDIINNRNEYHENTANPLKKSDKIKEKN